MGRRLLYAESTLKLLLGGCTGHRPIGCPSWRRQTRLPPRCSCCRRSPRLPMKRPRSRTRCAPRSRASAGIPAGRRAGCSSRRTRAICRAAPSGISRIPSGCRATARWRRRGATRPRPASLRRCSRKAARCGPHCRRRPATATSLPARAPRSRSPSSWESASSLCWNSSPTAGPLRRPDWSTSSLWSAPSWGASCGASRPTTSCAAASANTGRSSKTPTTPSSSSTRTNKPCWTRTTTLASSTDIRVPSCWGWPWTTCGASPRRTGRGCARRSKAWAGCTSPATPARTAARSSST